MGNLQDPGPRPCFSRTSRPQDPRTNSPLPRHGAGRRRHRRPTRILEPRRPDRGLYRGRSQAGHPSEAHTHQPPWVRPLQGANRKEARASHIAESGREGARPSPTPLTSRDRVWLRPARATVGVSQSLTEHRKIALEKERKVLTGFRRHFSRLPRTGLEGAWSARSFPLRFVLTARQQ